MCTRGDIITRADLAGEHGPASRAEASCDAVDEDVVDEIVVDEIVVVSSGCEAELVELVRRPIAAPPDRRALCVEWSGERSLDDAVAIEPAVERTIERTPCR